MATDRGAYFRAFTKKTPPRTSTGSQRKVLKRMKGLRSQKIIPAGKRKREDTGNLTQSTKYSSKPLCINLFVKRSLVAQKKEDKKASNKPNIGIK